MTGASHNESHLPKRQLVSEEDEGFVHDEFSEDPFNYDENILSPEARAALASLESREYKQHESSNQQEPVTILNTALAEDPFASDTETLIPHYIRSMIVPVRNAYLVSAYEYAHKGDSEARKAFVDATKQYDRALDRMREGKNKEANDAFVQQFTERDKEVLAHLEQALIRDGALAKHVHAVQESLSEPKRSLIGKLAQSPLMKKFRGMFMALAAFTLASDSSQQVPPQTYPTEDTGARERVSPPSSESVETERNVIAIEVPATGALSALKEVVAHAHDVSWLPAWLEAERQAARPDLVATREGRLDVLAQRLGFLSYLAGEEGPRGQWVAHSAPIPAGATILLSESGMSLRMPDGTVQTLVYADDRGVVNVEPYVY